MKKALEVTNQDIAGIRSGRATPALVENIVIACYGGSQHLKVMEMATITTMDAKTIVIAPYDPSVIAEIENGIGMPIGVLRLLLTERLSGSPFRRFQRNAGRNISNSPKRNWKPAA